MKRTLNEQDHNFALEIVKDFGIPLQVLTNIIHSHRTMKQLKGERKDFPSWKRTKYADLIRIVDSPDFKINKIHLETPGDVIHLSEDDPLFRFFNSSIKLFRANFRKEMIRADKEFTREINKWSEKQIFKFFISYFKIHNLIQFNQRAIIGLFLCHFEIDGRDPIMTPDQWVKNMGSADNYYDYLNNRVKYRHTKYLKEFAP